MREKAAWDEAFDEGYRKGYVRSLLQVGRHRFGDADPRIEEALAAIRDADRLQRMARAVLSVKSWKALLSVK
jgi:hypothetical protein